MTILIIGSKGFIGSHCVSYFSRSHTVWQCDVVVDYTANNYIQVDASNADYHEVFQAAQFDVCINCSGAASVPDSLVNPQRDFMLNTVNVFKQLDAIRKFNSECKYINMSSAAVYGNPNYLPIDESHPLLPISPYGVHKKITEEICASFQAHYGLQTCSLRIFSAYGEGLQKQLFWDLHKKSKEKSTVSLFGSGLESRDFIHIEDVVQAIDLVINQETFEYPCYNIANGKEITIRAVTEVFYMVHNPTVSITFRGQTRPGDPINWVADISRIKALGYVSHNDIQTGLTLYHRWLEENA